MTRGRPGVVVAGVLGLGVLGLIALVAYKAATALDAVKGAADTVTEAPGKAAGSIGDMLSEAYEEARAWLLGESDATEEAESYFGYSEQSDDGYLYESMPE